MKKVLITGGAGFIGFHLAKRLAELEYDVHIADDLSRAVEDSDFKNLCVWPNVNYHKIDLLETEALNRLALDYDHIYHLAAIIGVMYVTQQPYRVLVENQQMMVNMVELARRQQRLSRFLFASTSEIYAGTLRHFEMPIPTPEDSPLAITPLYEGRTSYMLSKIYGEAMCQQSGIPFTIFRPHNVYGPRMGLAHVIPEVLQRAHNTGDGDPLEYYSAEHKRTFCYVSDAIEIMVRAAEKLSCENETLNVGMQGPEVSIRELVNVISWVVGKNFVRLERDPQEGSPTRRCPNMGKTKRLTEYSATKGLEEGISLTYEWYRQKIFDGVGVSAI